MRISEPKKAKKELVVKNKKWLSAIKRRQKDIFAGIVDIVAIISGSPLAGMASTKRFANFLWERVTKKLKKRISNLKSIVADRDSTIVIFKDLIEDLKKDSDDLNDELEVSQKEIKKLRKALKKLRSKKKK